MLPKFDCLMLQERCEIDLQNPLLVTCAASVSQLCQIYLEESRVAVSIVGFLADRKIQELDYFSNIFSSKNSFMYLRHGEICQKLVMTI